MDDVTTTQMCATETRDEAKELFQESQKNYDDAFAKNKPTNLSVKQSFLTMFKMVDPNGKYIPVKKKLFYHIIGQALVEHPIANCMLEIDMRESFGVCIESGLGKESIKNVVIETCKETGQKYVSLVSFHEEQLIGKKWQGKDKEMKEVKGYFAKDFIIRDDGLPFINSPKFELARNYMLTNLDVYGKNHITKRLVEMDSSLDYLGHASFLYFVQPSEKINEQNLASGLFRRAPILRIDLTQEEIEEIIDKRGVVKYNPEPDAWFKFLRYMRNCGIIHYKEIDLELMKQINAVVKQNLVRNGLLGGLAIANQNTIIKWAYINSLLSIYKKNIIKPNIPKPNTVLTIELTEESLKQAIQDFGQVYESIKTFAEKNSKQPINHPIDKILIQYLKTKKCVSEVTSTVSPKELCERTAKVLRSELATVKGRYYDLKEKGIIDSKQVGQHGGKVWIKHRN